MRETFKVDPVTAKMTKIAFMDIKKHDLFVLKDSEGTPEDGTEINVATSDAYYSDKSGVPTVLCSPIAPESPPWALGVLDLTRTLSVE